MATTDGKLKISVEFDVDAKKSLDGMVKDINYLQKQLDKLDQKPIELLSDKELEKMSQLHTAIDRIKLDILKDAGIFKEFGLGDIEFDNFARAKQTFAAFGYDLDDIYKQLMKTIDATDELGEHAKDAGVNLGAIFASGLGQILKGGIANSFTQIGGITKKVTGSIKNMFTNIVKGAGKGAMSMKRMMMAMVGAQSIFTIISKATRQYLAQNEELNTKLQTMWSTLGQLVGPVVEYIVNLILKLMGYFMAFIKLLGVNTDALKKQAKASQASAKAQERQVAAFDEMNKLSDTSGGKGSYDLPEFNIGSIDDLGKTIAEKINDLLDAINWEKLQLKVHHIMEKIIDNLNDFVSTLNWERLGFNLAQGFNTALIVLYDFVKNFDVFAFAKRLSDGFATLINNINWGEVAQTLILGITNIWNAIWIFISNTVQKINWNSIADKLEYGLKKINWKEVLGSLAVNFLNALVALLEFNFVRLPQLILSTIVGVFEGLGQDSIAGFFKGISELLVNLGTWIKENIFNPFINWIKQLFGIHSPSTVMADIGKMIMQGLLDGITSLVDSVSVIWSNLKVNIINTWVNIKEWIVSVVNIIRDAVVQKFTNARDTALNIWTSFKTKVGEVFDGIWGKVKNVVNSILGGVEAMANGVVSAINTIIRALNNLRFDIPSWVPIYGGKSFGFNLGQLNKVYIPRLAQGAVIPPNREFLAVLGDQKSGTNIEAPLDTIVEAFRQVQGEGYDRPIVVQLVCDSKVLARAVADGQRKLDLSFNR